jgi:peroxiredoxin
MSDLLQVGQPIPKLEVMTTDARMTTVQSHLGPRQTLLYFLHGTWCPECVGQYHLLQRYLPRIRETGAELLVITGEELETLATFLQSAHPSLEYSVFTDPERHTYHIIGARDDTVAVIVDGRGIVHWFARWSDHQGEPSYETILQILRGVSSHLTGKDHHD